MCARWRDCADVQPRLRTIVAAETEVKYAVLYYRTLELDRDRDFVIMLI